MRRPRSGAVLVLIAVGGVAVAGGLLALGRALPAEQYNMHATVALELSAPDLARQTRSIDGDCMSEANGGSIGQVSAYAVAFLGVDREAVSVAADLVDGNRLIWIYTDGDHGYQGTDFTIERITADRRSGRLTFQALPIKGVAPTGLPADAGLSGSMTWACVGEPYTYDPPGG